MFYIFIGFFNDFSTRVSTEISNMGTQKFSKLFGSTLEFEKLLSGGQILAYNLLFMDFRVQKRA